MVYSASAISAEQTMGKPLYFFVRQLIWAVISLSVMGWLSRLDYNRLREWIAPIYGVTATLLLAARFSSDPIAGAQKRFGSISARSTSSRRSSRS